MSWDQTVLKSKKYIYFRMSHFKDMDRNNLFIFSYFFKGSVKTTKNISMVSVKTKYKLTYLKV